MSDPRHIKVVVTGGRDYDDKSMLHQVLGILGLDDDNEYCMPHHLSIAHGGAEGADTLADDWAVVHWIPVKVYEAKWAEHGKKAGPMRNEAMLAEFEPDLVVAFPGGRGTAHCCEVAKKKGVLVLDVSRFPQAMSLEFLEETVKMYRRTALRISDLKRGKEDEDES